MIVLIYLPKKNDCKLTKVIGFNLCDYSNVRTSLYFYVYKLLFK